MDKPTIITTRKPLPFGELSPLEFERMCLWLVEREDYLDPQHLGEAGSEQGRDIVAFKRTDDGGQEMWFFQCKRHQRISASTLKEDVEKYGRLVKVDKRPAGVIFITSAPVSARARESIQAYCSERHYRCGFWARTELDMLVKKHPDIVEEFFGNSTVVMPSALHQLPPSPRDFTGRITELNELRKRLEHGGVGILGLQGQGGVGKTALGLKLAEEVIDQYPDAQFYLDLKGTSKAPMPTADAMTFIIAGYNPGAKFPEKEDQLRALYYSVLHDKRALLVMDNAADAWQVEPLIPPRSCLLLVTSRQHFILPGLFQLKVESLPATEALELLLKICPRIGGEGEELTKLCGHLPLALRLAASALAERIDISATDYISRLRDIGQRLKLLNQVDASLRLSYDLMSTTTKNLWRLLALFPASFDAAAAEAILGLHGDVIQETLGESLKYSMVQWDELVSRYHLHDLVRLFADSLLNDNERNIFAKRHSGHYLNVCWRINILYQQGGDAFKSGMAEFDREWLNIQAGLGWAKAKADQDVLAARMCSDYLRCSIGALSLRQKAIDRVKELEAGLIASRKLNDRESEAGHLNNLGLAYSELGDMRSAIAFHEQSLAVAREIKNRFSEASALHNLGKAYRALGQVPRAIEFFEEALCIAREIDDLRGEGNSLGSLGSAFHDLGDTRGAIKYYQDYLTIALKIGDRVGESAAVINLGMAYAGLGETERALKYYHQGLLITREIGDRVGESSALGSLGNAYYDLGDMEKAIDLHSQDLSICKEIGDRIGEGAASGNLGLAYAGLGETSRAIEYYRQHLAIARESGDRQGEGNALGNLGIAYKTLGQVPEAIEFYDEYLGITREIGDRRGECIALWNMCLSLAMMGKSAEAISHAEAALELCERIEHPLAAQVRMQLAAWGRA